MVKSNEVSENAICPFRLERASRDSLTDQLTNGLRDAIHFLFCEVVGRDFVVAKGHFLSIECAVAL